MANVLGEIAFQGTLNFVDRPNNEIRKNSVYSTNEKVIKSESVPVL